MTFRELAKIWIDYKKDFVKESTISTYAYIIERHLEGVFGDKTEITEEEVQRYIIDKTNEGGLKRNSIKDQIVVLKTMLKWGAKKGHVKFTGFDLEYPGKPTKTKLDVYDTETCDRFSKYLIENFTFKNFTILIALNTGLRIGEVCALKWGDIDLDAGVLFVRRTVQRIHTLQKNTKIVIDEPKTESSKREVPLSSDLRKFFRPLLKITNPEFYINSNAETPLEPRQFRAYYTALAKHIGLEKLKFHGLRHTFATRMIKGKADVKTVSMILGHSDVSITLNTYVHPTLEQKKEAINKVFKGVKL